MVLKGVVPPVAAAPVTEESGSRVVYVGREMMGAVEASYSADKIANKESRVTKPFSFEDKLFISTGNTCSVKKVQWECYRLMPLEEFDGEVHTYVAPRGYAAELDGDDYYALLRSIPEGFYHGMKVKHGKNDCVLVGPKIIFQGREDKKEHASGESCSYLKFMGDDGKCPATDKLCKDYYRGKCQRVNVDEKEAVVHEGEGSR